MKYVKHLALAALLLIGITSTACTPEQVISYGRQQGVEISGPDAREISKQLTDDSGSKSVPDMIVEEFAGTGHEQKALKVAKCESGFNPSAKNSSSSASGVFQIIRGTWNAYARPGESVWNARDNIRVAYRIWKASNQSWRQWVCRG